MSTFLQASGILFWVSLLGAGAWSLACWGVDKLRASRATRAAAISEYQRLALWSQMSWRQEASTNAHGLAAMAPQAISVLDDQIAHPEWWLGQPVPRVLRLAVNVLARREQEREAKAR